MAKIAPKLKLADEEKQKRAELVPLLLKGEPLVWTGRGQAGSTWVTCRGVCVCVCLLCAVVCRPPAGAQGGGQDHEPGGGARGDGGGRERSHA